MKRAAAAAGFIAAIIAANYLTTEHGMIPVGLGLTATAGTYLAGATFVLRDAVQDTAGRRAAIALIAAGAALSYLIADPFIALASGVAFATAELADQAIYTPLRRRGYIRAAIASNAAGAVVDTFLFLWVAGFPVAGAWQGQLLAKATITAAAIATVAAYRRRTAAEVK
jgi:uncharacterized PurR-regulated membrane protein YhhQ (DUF165 family)